VKRPAAGALIALLLAACHSDPAVRTQRLGPGHYRLTVDRCHAIDPEQLQRDLRGLAEHACPEGAGALEAVQSIPSRQGSLLGECPRQGALRAEVTCR